MTRALVFDCDGVLADTERDGHLPAFNATFEQFGLPVRWSESDYADVLRIGGGKERLTSLLTPTFVAEAGLPAEAGGQEALVRLWHGEKTRRYTALVRAGIMPGRPGIARLAREAHEAGWLLAVASTSAEESVRAVLEHAVGTEAATWFAVFAGDVVAHKKPAPDIYEHTLRELGVQVDDTVVIEDSANGLQAALACGLTTVVTTSSYTRHEDFTGAALVVDSLGDPPKTPARVIADPHHVADGTDGVTLATVMALTHQRS